MMQQREEVKEQQNVWEVTSLDLVRSSTRSIRIIPSQQQATRESKCTRCGKRPHIKRSYPVKDATCCRFRRKGYFAAVCFSRTITVFQQEELEPAETSHLDAITNRGNRKKQNHGISKDVKNACYKIDTDVEVSAISTDAFEALRRSNLQKTAKTMCGPDRNLLRC